MLSMRSLHTSWLAAVEDNAQAALVLLSSAMIFALVLTRYLLAYSDASVEQIARYLAIWGTFLGLATAHRRGFSIRFSVLEHLLPERARQVLAGLVWLASAGICFALMWAGWLLVDETRTLGEVMQTGFALPLWIPKAALAVGAALLGIELLASAVRSFAGDPAHENEHGGH